MNDNEKIPRLAELSGLPIYDKGPLRMDWQYPCIVREQYRYVYWHDAYNPELFSPYDNLGQAWLVATAWCDKHGLQFEVGKYDGEIQASVAKELCTEYERFAWIAVGDNPATALCEAVLKAAEVMDECLKSQRET